ncbi:MAG: Spy/CpxP family protein refolding chaperone [Desulfobacteraceae bacterium]|nr:Spy/CpxP family protein refolding chaperone [Desulfobacteraceae bacterium]
MKRRAYQVAFPAGLVVVMVMFLSAIFFATAEPSFAASAKKKSTAVARTSAVEHTEARIAELQVALKITAEQEPLWSNLTLVMRDNAKNMDALTKDRADAMKTMNSVEQMKFQSQISEARLDQLKRFIPPYEALYSSMTDEQKKAADTLFRTGKHGKHRMK